MKTPPLPFSRIALLLLLALNALALSGCGTTADRSLAAQSAAIRGATPEETLGNALREVDSALNTGLDTPQEQAAYATAVELAVDSWLAVRDQPESQIPGYRVKLITPPNMDFDELVAARLVKSRTMNRRVTHDGVGVPYVAHLNYAEERAKTEPFLSKGGYIWPVNITVDFGPERQGAREARITVHDSRDAETERLAGKSHPLAADFTAVGEYVLARKQGTMPKLAALLRSGKFLNDLELIALEPLDGERIPLIMVHGLMSRPATWHQLYNELQDVPEIRQRYQILLFRYPSGVPVLYSATRFREELATLHKEMVHLGGGAASNRTVVIGHSMGGLVTKMQVQSSGGHLWVSLFGETREALDLKPEAEAALSPYLEFQPNPHVDRVIFAATPHRGSRMADGLPGFIGRHLISLPGNILGNAFDALQSITPAGGALAQLNLKRVPNSIDNLSPESTFVKTSMALPLRPDLKIHTIAGNKKNLPLTDPKAGDGVVPYTSAHLDGVESELVVPGSGHGVHETPEAFTEIRRILLLHLAEGGG